MLWWWLACGEVDKIEDSGVSDNIILAEALAGEDIYLALGETISLTTGDSTGVSFEWNMDDGTVYDGTTLEHTYAGVGRYRIILSAIGSGGERDSDILNVVVHAPLQEVPPQSNHSMVVVEQGIWSILPESNSLHFLPFNQTESLEQIEVCQHPTSVALFNQSMVVSCSAEPALVLIDLSTEPYDMTELSLPTGYRPSALLPPTETDPRWWVIDSATGQVGHFIGDETISWIDVGDDLKGIARHSDGTILLPEFRSKSTGGEIHTLDPTTGNLSTIPLSLDTMGDSDNTTGGVPNLLETVYPSPDGSRIYTPYSHANIVRGDYLSGQSLTHETSLRGILGYLDWTTQSETVDTRKHFDEKGRATALAFSPFGDLIYLLHSGVATISVIDAFSHQILGSIPNVGLSPTDILQHQDTLYVYSWLTREILAYTIADPMRPALLWQRSFIQDEPLDETILLGKQIFHDASDPRMTRTGYIACAHCHPNADHDGQTWDFTDRGEGLRNTTSLWGRGAMNMGPFHWSGNFDEPQDFENDIRLHFGGSGFLEDSDWDLVADPLGESKATLSPELDALAAYMYSLNSIPTSPYTLEESAYQEALATFVALDCHSCHGGDWWTDSDIETMIRHDVGTITDASGSRLGQSLDGLDTPTLLGLSSSAPYLHDGSAATIEDAIRAHIGYEQLDSNTIADLVSLLHSL